MAEPELSPEVRKALDSYAVPPLPGGFADRLMAKIDAGDTSGVAPATGLANRLRRGGPTARSAWRRSGRIMGSVAFLSLATATAAAAGFFGNPVYVPGVSEVLAKAELVPAVRSPASEKPKPLAVQATEVAAQPTALPPANGTEAVVSRIEQMRNDPAFAELTPRQRLAVGRKEVRSMIRSGETTRPEARAAVREIVRNADPETKAQWREATAVRREARLDRREQAAQAPTDSAPVATAAAEPEPATASDEIPALANGNLAPEKVEALRERYREATPAQRAEMRRALRERRTTRQLRRQ